MVTCCEILKLGVVWKKTHPSFQNFIAGVVIFLQAGFYLALTGLGAGGGRPSSESIAAWVNCILYGAFCIFCILGSALMNTVGPRWTMSLSAVGYALYTGGLWLLDKQNTTTLAYISGAAQGICAAMLWTSAGTIAYSYAEERAKARYVTGQWVFCAAGSSIASIIMIIINSEETYNHADVPQSLYIVLLTLQLISIPVAALCLVRPSAVIRNDGNKIAKNYNTTWKTEFQSYGTLLITWKFLLLLPAMLTGEIALAPQSSINGYFFNIRTRCLNNILFSCVQIPASLGISWWLDTKRVFENRKSRAVSAIIVVAAASLGVSACQIAWIVQNNINRRVPGPSTDWSDAAFSDACPLFIFYGVVYGTYQIVTQYVITSITNDPLILARYSGIFRSTNALGLMVSFIIEAANVSYLIQQIIQLIAYAIGMLSLLVVTLGHMAPSNYYNASEDNVIIPADMTNPLGQNQGIELQDRTT